MEWKPPAPKNTAIGVDIPCTLHVGENGHKILLLHIYLTTQISKLGHPYETNLPTLLVAPG